jgi:DNA-binding NtrC family response regulator
VTFLTAARLTSGGGPHWITIMDDCVVLLVDDEQGFRDVLARRLTRRGHTVLSAPGGLEAVESLVVNSDVDVVVLDVLMPGLDGFEVLARVKRLRPHVEVVLLTAFSTQEGALRALTLGAFDYLSKPCDLDLLLGAIEAMAKRKRRQEGKVCQARATLLKHRAEHGDAPWPEDGPAILPPADASEDEEH